MSPTVATYYPLIGETLPFTCNFTTVATQTLSIVWKMGPGTVSCLHQHIHTQTYETHSPTYATHTPTYASHTPTYATHTPTYANIRTNIHITHANIQITWGSAKSSQKSFKIHFSHFVSLKITWTLLR